MIDLHIHLLPGLDDGPADSAATVELARACVADGIDAVVATPHVSERYPTTVAAITTALTEARSALTAAGVELAVEAGAEIAIDQLDRLGDDDLVALSFGGRGTHLLLETPYAAWPLELERQLMRLGGLGIRGVLAHPERSVGVQKGDGLERIERAVGRGLLVQVTAGSLTGRFGRTAQQTAHQLLQRELVHLVSTDAHDTTKRPPELTAAGEVLGAERARWLTTDVPAAILRGGQLPPRPPAAAAGRRGLFRRLVGGSSGRR